MGMYWCFIVLPLPRDRIFTWFKPSPFYYPKLSAVCFSIFSGEHPRNTLEKYSNRTSERVKSQKSDAPQVKSTNPLDNLDFGSEDFKNGVKALGELLKVSSHPDPLVTLHAVSTLVTNLSSQDKTNSPKTGTPFPIMEADLGFDLGDYVLNQASRVLRLLYIHDLRSLQTCINEAIVGVQNLTADPKTDTKLGKVGR